MRRAAAAGLCVAIVAALGQSHAAPHAAAPAPTMSPALALAALDRKIADLDGEEQATKNELSQLGPELGVAHTRTLAHGRAFYRLTRAGMLPVGGGFDELVRHAIHVERERRAVAADVDAERRLRSRGAELAQTLERVARDRITLASQRTEMDAARIAMEDETRRQAAFDRAFQTSTGGGDYVAVYGGAGASIDNGARDSFLGARGRLLFPVVGRAEVRPGHREGTDGPGLEIRTVIGTPVRAVFAGRVAFADRYGPYGRLVIVDHGDHYYSVSGDLASVDVKVGEEVGAGERIGAVGDDGQGAMLYFEIRHGSQTVPPQPWLGL